ncbi:MAG: hypothetical protein QW331_03595 [Candidatus Woesearchaeota archaeon]
MEHKVVKAFRKSYFYRNKVHELIELDIEEEKGKIKKLTWLSITLATPV